MATYNYNEIAKRTRNAYNYTKESRKFDVVLVQYDSFFVAFDDDAKTIMSDASDFVKHYEDNFAVISCSNLGKVIQRVIFKTACNVHIV